MKIDIHGYWIPPVEKREGSYREGRRKILSGNGANLLKVK